MARKRRDAEATDTYVAAKPVAAAPPPEGPELFVFHGDRVRVFPVSHRATIVIGRSRGCDVIIDHKTVSRRHARFVVDEPAVVEDLGSSNGTMVGTRRLATGERAMIPPGQVVMVGAAAVVLQMAAGGIVDPGRAEWVSAEPDPRPTIPPTDRDVPPSSMARADRLLKLVARGDISVLLQGETGAGKEVAAAALHAASPRALGPFVELNCAALPETLLEAELFGFERGAFTGADRAKPGLLELASGGTVFLDEVGEMPLDTQAKLLRVLERREVLPLGGIHPRAIDVRFVAATNRDLGAEVARGSFRRDLFYRLNGVEIRIPPLRERRDELLPLARTFVEEARRRLGFEPTSLSSASEKRLMRHGFPGNIRELRNTIDRAVLLSEGGTIEPEHLALGEATETHLEAPVENEEDLRRAVAGFERQRILDALDRSGGNQTTAAKLLGIPRRTLVFKLREYGIGRTRR